MSPSSRVSWLKKRRRCWSVFSPGCGHRASDIDNSIGGVPEWLIGALSKSVVQQCTVGSNPTPSASSVKTSAEQYYLTLGLSGTDELWFHFSQDRLWFHA